MRFLVVDDEPLAVEALLSTLAQVDPQGLHSGVWTEQAALEALQAQTFDVVFLDIEIPGMGGLGLAVRIKELCPVTNIVFVTGHSKYALEAHGLYVSGFLLKPITAADVRTALDHLRIPQPAVSTHVRVHTFGSFDVFVDGTLLPFTSAKAKELLAYLVHKAGAGVTVAELASVLWEDRPYDRYLQNQTQKIITYMRQTLRLAGIEDMVIKPRRNCLAVDTAQFSSDYDELLHWNVNSYHGEYMVNYSWAEMRNAALARKFLP